MSDVPLKADVHMKELQDSSRATRAAAENNRGPENEDVGGIMRNAWRLLAEGRREDAVAMARKVPAGDPLEYKALCLIGEVLRQSPGHFEAAYPVLERAIALAPHQPQAYLELAWLQFTTKRDAAALGSIEKAKKCAALLAPVESFIRESLVQIEVRAHASRVAGVRADG